MHQHKKMIKWYGKREQLKPVSKISVGNDAAIHNKQAVRQKISAEQHRELTSTIEKKLNTKTMKFKQNHMGDAKSVRRGGGRTSLLVLQYAHSLAFCLDLL